jgi:hypothetical protein
LLLARDFSQTQKSLHLDAALRLNLSPLFKTRERDD